MFDRSVVTAEGLFAELFLAERPAGLDYEQMTDRVEKFEVLESMIAAAKAVELTAYGETFTDGEMDYFGVELGHALHLSPGQAGAMMREATDITGPFHPVLAALAGGRITQRHAKTIRQVLSHLTFTATVAEKDTAAYALVLEKAALIAKRGCEYAQTHTPTETRRILASWVIAHETMSAEARHDQARSQTNVTHQVLDDGIGMLSVTGPVELTYRAYKAIDATARHQARTAMAGDELRIGQRRSDVLLETLMDAATPRADGGADGLVAVAEQPIFLPGTPITTARVIYDAGPILFQSLLDDETCDPYIDPADLSIPEDPGPESCDIPLQRGADIGGRFTVTGEAPYQVQVTCDLETLLGLANNPMILDGTIPITASHGRRLFDQADFLRLLLEQDTGELIDKSPHVYRPNRATADYVRARDQVCRVPGCNTPASDCEIDHEKSFNHSKPHEGGLTMRRKLGNLCKRHHQLKTHHGFWIETTLDGSKHWVTPHGRRYLMTPHDLRPSKQARNDIHDLEIQAIATRRINRMCSA